jgi:predicted house-cleaning noncanonical NTP pyrophosphatase (MazG superfamily)
MPPLPRPKWPLRSFVIGEDATYPKLKCQTSIAAVGGQTTTFIVMDDEATWKELFEDRIPEPLRAAITELLEGGPVVARTDVISDSTTKSLPRSDCILTWTQAKAFLADKLPASAALRNARNPILILHRFIPARACAFAYVRSQSDPVQIDATYGVPDGLSVFPHDTYLVGPRDDIQRRVRFKATYLDQKEDGSWQPQRSDPELGWSPALSDAQVVAMATLARRISQHEGRPLLAMFFASGPPDIMPDGVLPWILDYEIPVSGKYAETSRGLYGVPVVHDSADLSRVAKGDHPPSRVIYRPPSSGDAIRDDPRHSAVGNLAKATGISLIWEGSILAHVWYVLGRTGATILPVAVEDLSGDEPAMQEFNKLVRDGIPAKIERAGERALTVSVSGESLLRLLRQKLVEESLEVFGTSNRQELIEELADVREVVDALMSAAQLDSDEVEAAQLKKREARGGFDRGIVLRQTMVTKDGDALPIADSPHESLSDQKLWELTDARPEVINGDVISVPRVPSGRAFDLNRSPLNLVVRGLVFEVVESAKAILLRFRGQHAQSDPSPQLTFLSDD